MHFNLSEVSPEIAVLKYDAQLSAQGVQSVVKLLTAPSLATKPAIIHDFNRTRMVEFPIPLMVDMAMRRRKSLPLEPSKPVRAGFVAPVDQVKSTLEPWRLFFNEDNPAYVCQFFDSYETAYNWVNAFDPSTSALFE